MRELLARLRDWLRRAQLGAELTEELRFHRELLERDARADGVQATDAAYVARRRLGNVTRVHEDARDRWSVPWLDHLRQDARYALRGLRRAPGFTTAVVLTLGLGIGANAAMFGVIDRLMFRPYPYLRDPGSVDRVYLRTAGWERDNAYAIFPYTRYLDLKRWTTSFSQYAAFVTATHGVGTGDAARERGVVGVSASFFEFFEARPALGRFFVAAEDGIPVGANVAVLSFQFWNAELGGRDVIGEAIQVGNVPYTIIGVAPEGFVGVSEGSPPAVFIPITAYAANQGGGSRADYFLKYNWDWTQMMVRRKPGVSRATATSDLTDAMLRSWNASRAVHLYGPAERMRPRAVVGALKTAAGPNPGLEAKTLLWVTGVAVIVLVIACANVANLFLARALRRKREVALRLALGVSRGRLAAHAFTESLVLSVLGCAAGIAIAQWGGFVLRRLFIPSTARFDVVTDWRTLAVAMSAALVAAVATGLAPVFFAGRDDITTTLKAGAREGTYQRSGARAILLVTQGALSVVLLVGAVLFVRSLDNVRGLRLGYEVDRVLLVEWEGRGTPMDSSDRAALRHRLLETALARPDVERGAWTNSAPFGRGTSIMNLAVPGVDSVSRLGRFTYQIASSDYFATVGTRILRGRAFTDRDRVGATLAVVVSAAMAARLWPDQDALGRCLRISWRSTRPDTMPCTTVVGVAENAVHDPIADHPMRYYLPESQLDFGATWLLLRMRRDPAAAAEDVRRALQAVMPGQSLVTVQPARELFDAKRRSWLVGATMFVGFGILALLVAAIGLYGVITYNVAQRMHELGVRIALGAQATDVLRLVIGQGVRLAAAGIVVGSTLALAAARWIQPLLFQQSAKDPAVFGLAGALLIGVALVASAVPAAKAMRANPTTVLRTE
jgi:putative ABC transport system permease protein